MRLARALISLTTGLALAGACSRGEQVLGESPLPDAAGGSSGAGGTSSIDAGCTLTCSDDGRSVVSSCADAVQQACAADEVCHDTKCQHACTLAEESKASVGCDYFAVNMDIHTQLAGSCFVAYVTNTFGSPAHLEVDFAGDPIDLAQHAAEPVGAGADVKYEPYDPAVGLGPGKVALIFLSNAGGVECPVPAARDTGAWVHGTGWGTAFRIRSDVPVVAFQMLPYGGGSAAVTGASLLLPTSAWGTNYVAANAWPATALPPSLNIVAMEDDTEVTILPGVAIEGREGIVPSSPANTPITYTLESGEFLQLTQGEELTGSPIESTKKIAVFGGSQCMYVPFGDSLYCDHAEQQLPPVQAMGHRYVAAHYRPRTEHEKSFLYRVVGAVPGTVLSYDPPVADAPASIEPGEAIEIWSEQPFVVSSQDKDHPFLLFSYMTGGEVVVGGFGDPDFVRVITPAQYLKRYVFFTDPTYPETSLVVIRKRDDTEQPFSDVTLACKGVLDGWQAVGSSGLYELTRVDLVRHDFEPQGACNNGAQEMTSEQPFGVTVWSWGGPETSGGSCGDGPGTVPGTFTCHVSYGYPAGESVQPVNEVVIPPVPR